MFVIYQGLRNPKPHLQQIIFLSTLAGGGIMLRNIFIFFLLMSLTSKLMLLRNFMAALFITRLSHKHFSSMVK